MLKELVLLSLLYAVATGSSLERVRPQSNELRMFPDGFQFGTATASYQIEGAWNVSDKGVNIWDHMTHTQPWRIADGSNGDEAGDSYHKYERDVEMLRELGVDYYRFSLSWTRILPTGFSNYVSADGVNYYNNLINELLKYNIEPMITLYHWDLPQSLQDLGGFTNPLMVTWFEDYARVVYDNFADRVKMWTTFNEPNEICYQGYADASKAPAYEYDGTANYQCSYTLLKAHAAAWHLYDDEYRSLNNGVNGIVLSTSWYEPASDSEDDVAAAEDQLQFMIGVYANPIFSTEGDFPAAMKEKINKKSMEQGFPRSRLPEFTPEEVDYIRGTADYFGMNHYFSRYVYRNASTVGAHKSPSMSDDIDSVLFTDPEWPVAHSPWLTSAPWGFRKLINFIRDRYNDPEIFVTENGWSSTDGLNDDDRVLYYREYLTAMLAAIHDDGCRVTKYTAWSLMDNFEWMEGLTSRFGLYEVDFSDPEKKRTARKSALVYKEIIRSRVVDFAYEPETLEISIS